MLRDSLLRLTGRLNPKAGGPGVRLPLPAEIRGTLLKNHAGAEADEVEQRRRSIYVFARRNARQPIFDLFDRPDALLSCARRETSTTAPQALLLLNAGFAQESAAALADLALAAGEGDPRASATHALRRCLAREPLPEEVEEAVAFLSADPAASLREAFADYCLALINTNEFVHVD